MTTDGVWRHQVGTQLEAHSVTTNTWLSITKSVIGLAEAMNSVLQLVSQHRLCNNSPLAYKVVRLTRGHCHTKSLRYNALIVRSLLMIR